MSDFPGYGQRAAILTRLRSELLKSVITADAPRVFDGTTHLPLSGGYGLTLPATDFPEHWGAGRITTTYDELCPIVEAHRWLSIASGETIGGVGRAPFEEVDLRDQTDTETDDELLFGAGLIAVDMQDVAPVVDTAVSGVGRGGRLAMPIDVMCTVRVPPGRSTAQGDLYCGLLARVLTNAEIVIDDDSTLSFQSTPETVAAIEADGWLILPFVATATREYSVPYVF